MRHYLGIDVGGSSIKYGIVDEKGNLSNQGKVPVPENLELFYQQIKALYNQFENISGIGLSMPGAVDVDQGIIAGSSAIDYIHGPNIKHDIEALTGVQVELDNDANCAALAEVWIGNASDINDSAFVVCGSGIGGAIIKDKQIHRGKNFHGGEFGDMIQFFDYETKTFKNWSECGATASVINFVANKLNVDKKTLDGKEIFDHQEDNPIYKEAVDRFYYSLAIGMFNLQYAYDPERIIIGGAISQREEIIDEINKRMDIVLEKLQIADIRPNLWTCKYYNDANIIGAVYHLMTRLKEGK